MRSTRNLLLFKPLLDLMLPAKQKAVIKPRTRRRSVRICIENALSHCATKVRFLSFLKSIPKWADRCRTILMKKVLLETLSGAGVSIESELNEKGWGTSQMISSCFLNLSFRSHEVCKNTRAFLWLYLYPWPQTHVPTQLRLMKSWVRSTTLPSP